MEFPQLSSRMIKVKVTPNARKTEYQETLPDGTIKIRLQASPTDGKANIALIDFVEEITWERWEIISGHTSTRKLLKKTIKY